jgi:hypothetical protein
MIKRIVVVATLALAGCERHTQETAPPPTGRYQMLNAPFRENDPSAHAVAVWRLDTATGALQYCEAAKDAPFIDAPVCSSINNP